MSDRDFVVIGWGLVAATVCTTLPIEEATRLLNVEVPTGISSPWSPATEDTFANGMPQPGKCEQDAARMHYLFHC